MHDGWMLGMGWGWLVLLVVLGLVIWLALRAATGGGRAAGGPSESAEETLRKRFASGEIDEKDFRSGMRTLRES